LEPTGTYPDYICGVLSVFKKPMQRGECGVGDSDSITAPIFSTSTEQAALNQVIKPVCSALKFHYVINLLLNIGCHFRPPFLTKQRVFS